MTTYLADDTDITAVANAIRTKGGTSAPLTFPNGFVGAIQNIPTGGTDFVVTLSYNSTTQMWEPDKTFADIVQAYSAGKDVALTTGEVSATVGCWYDSDLNRLVYMVGIEDGGGVIVQIYLYDANGLSLDDEYRSIYPVFETVTKTYNPSASTQTETVTYDSSNYNGLQQVNVTVNAVTTTNLYANNILSGVTVKVGTASDDDCIASVTGNVVIQNYYTGSAAPSSGTGNNGDLYLQT